MNSHLLNPVEQKDRWYREPWLLLVFGGPLMVVVASVMTSWIAFHGADQVVAKDYYRQGLMINTNLQRDDNARAWNVQANLNLRAESNQVVLNLSANRVLSSTVQLSIAISSVNRQGVNEIVHRLPLHRGPDGRYVGQLPQNPQGVLALAPSSMKLWHLKLETTEWRLTGDWHQPMLQGIKLTPVH